MPDVLSHPPRDWAHYSERFLDADYWRPLLALVARREQLDVSDAQLALPAGTYPTFLSDRFVVKLYTHLSEGAAGWRKETAVLSALADRPLAAPRLLASGQLDAGQERYFYVVQARVTGEPLSAACATLTVGELLGVARQLGVWTSVVHTTAVPLAVTGASGQWATFIAAQRTGLPARLKDAGSLTETLQEQAPAFVARWLPAAGELCLLHGDLHDDHLYGTGSPWRVCALIDFADARCGHPLYELGSLATSTLAHAPGMLDAFLGGYGWQVSDRTEFARRALAVALCHDFDVFADWRERLADLDSLDALAQRVFG